MGDGAIGEVKAVYADFGERPVRRVAHRLFAPDLVGGALLDLGIYPVSFAWMLLGEPGHRPGGDHTRADRGGREHRDPVRVRLGAVALLHCGFLAKTPQSATVTGTTGWIEVAGPFWHPDTMTLHRDGAEPQTFTLEAPGHGYTYQAEEVARCIEAGLTESPVMPLDETVAILGALDTIAESLSI